MRNEECIFGYDTEIDNTKSPKMIDPSYRKKSIAQLILFLSHTVAFVSETTAIHKY